MVALEKLDESTDPIEGVCPSCQQPTLFTFVGIQEYPPHLVLERGLRPSVSLWSCASCKSTFADEDLDLPND